MLGSTRRIVLIYDARSAFDFKVMKGVAAYLQENRSRASYSVYLVDRKRCTIGRSSTWQSGTPTGSSAMRAGA